MNDLDKLMSEDDEHRKTSSPPRQAEE
jgi:hypothetical protein